MRILLSAYSCAPNWGSEPGVGWSWAWNLSERQEVHVLTSIWSRPLIERALQSRPRSSLHFHFVPTALPSWFPVEGLPGWVELYLWQWKAYLAARRLHRIFRFDLAHHVTFAAWRAPSFLWKLGIPFIWGPVGGGQNIPPGFLSGMRWKAQAWEGVRSHFQYLSRADPWVRATLHHADLVLAANEPTRRIFPGYTQSKIRVMLEAGIHGADRPQAEIVRDPHPFRILWVGNLIPLKGLPLLLKGLTLLKDRTRVELTVVGDGPERRTYESMAREWGLERQVRFVGRLSYAETQLRYLSADLFAFTSLRDTSGNAVLEAMASGLPVVVVDWAGPREITSSDSAVKITPKTPSQVSEELCRSIERLMASFEDRKALGQAARKRIMERFEWSKRTLAMEHLYARLLEHGRAAPIDLG